MRQVKKSKEQDVGRHRNKKAQPTERIKRLSKIQKADTGSEVKEKNEKNKKAYKQSFMRVTFILKASEGG